VDAELVRLRQGRLVAIRIDATIDGQMRRMLLISAVIAVLLAVPATASASGSAAAVDSATVAQTAPASIVRVTVVKVDGIRVVRVRLNVTRHCDGVAKLRRNGRTLASSAKVHLMPGTRVLKIRVPRGVRAGRATVRVILTSGGQRWVLKRAVRIPR
jgi:hypothetical protein